VAGLTPRMNAVVAGQSDLATTSSFITAQGHVYARLT
jgi:hypothetical protein